MGAKHWRYEDDLFLVSYFDAMGDYIGTHDLGRPKGAATKRVAHLKATGAWDALVRKQQLEAKAGVASMRAEMEYAYALGYRVDERHIPESEVECAADIYDGDFPWRREGFGEDEGDYAWSSKDLGQIIHEAVANHNDVDGVAWRLVACEIAQQLGVMLVDVVPSTGLPRDLCGPRKRSEQAQ